jgi:hypothetical protein
VERSSEFSFREHEGEARLQPRTVFQFSSISPCSPKEFYYLCQHILSIYLIFEIMATSIIETGRLVVEDKDDTSHNIKEISTNGTPLHEKHEQTGWKPKNDDDFAVLAARNLVLDMTMKNGGGHGGSALGMAAIGIALWKHVMRFNPCDPDWFDRDRFVLSNGTASSQKLFLSYYS